MLYCRVVFPVMALNLVTWCPSRGLKVIICPETLNSAYKCQPGPGFNLWGSGRMNTPLLDAAWLKWYKPCTCVCYMHCCIDYISYDSLHLHTPSLMCAKSVGSAGTSQAIWSCYGSKSPRAMLSSTGGFPSLNLPVLCITVYTTHCGYFPHTIGAV